MKIISFVPIPTSIVAWLSFLSVHLAFVDHSAIVTMVASESLLLDREAQALLKSEWWSGYTDYTPSRCQWPGIVCNGDGSITEISLPPPFQLGDKFGKFNFSAFPNLVRLQLIGLGLVGNIPHEIGTLHKLTYLDLSLKEINGSIPSGIWKLKNLETLNLARNRLVGSVPSSLGHLTNLISLYLNSNHLSGCIPAEVGNLKNLIQLNLSDNNLMGSIPSTIGLITNLKSLALGWNHINGSIPLELDNLKNLDHLYLGINQLSGPIPPFLSHLTKLKSLELSSNSISGTLAPELTQLTQLEYLNLSSNQLSGELLLELGKFSKLLVLDVSWNGLRGIIPTNLANCSKFQGLILSHNFLAGSIPFQIGYLSSLTLIDLSSNSFSGEIPPQLGNITNSRQLDLSHNQLTGTIPHSLISLRRHNLSYNCLEGEVPNDFLSTFPSDTFSGNKDLCSDRRDFPPCFSPLPTSVSVKQIILNMKIFLPVTIFFASSFLGYLVFKIWKYNRVHSEARESKNGDLFSIWQYDGKIAYKDIIKATEDFDVKYCIGTGKFGSVYKARLPTGRIVALKKLHSLEVEEPAFLKSFKNEVSVLSKIRHRNIVKLHGFCLYK